MTNIILKILHDHICSAQTAPFDTDWEELLSLSKKQEVTAIVYIQCKSFIPKPFLHDFGRAFSSVLFYYANRCKIVERIENALEDIDHFTVKGSSVAQFYPYPALRTMGDTDIVVHTEDREEVDKRLKNLHLSCVSSSTDREWQYYYNNMEFELHDHLVYSESVNVNIQEQYFNDFWKYVKGNEIDWNFHFLFLILHLRKHFMNSGVGFRQFMDIAILTFRGPEFKWNWIKDELEKLELWKFTERVFALNEYWFAVPSPIAISDFQESFFSSATELILKNGIFGFDNEDNKSKAAVNAVRGEEKIEIAMLKRAIKGFFPPYGILITVPHYAYLKGKPFLLPIVWIHRVLNSIREGRVRSNIQTVVANSVADRETIEKQESIYKQWGL